MKVIFYPGSLQESNMTVSDAVLYCQILYRSICDGGREVFGVDGKQFTTEHFETDCGWYVPIGWSVTASIASEINITRRQYFRSKKKLEENGYITIDGVLLLDGITNSYFELKPKSGLSGLRLIVYSYLANKSAKYGWVDKYHQAIARELGIDRTNLEHILTDLRGLGLIKVKNIGERRLLRTT